MSIVDYAKRELDFIGMTEDSKDEMNQMMRKHILHMVEEFAAEGHSGFSASYAINCLNKILRYEPLSPLTGDDSEWTDVAEQSGRTLWQNKRCSRVFKDEDGAYDIDGKVFVETRFDENGEPYKTSFTSKESRVPVTFPYTPTTEYVDVGISE